MQSSPVIWTIGHSNHTFEHFTKLLQAEGIEVVVDVRSYPYSRIAPHFNREELERTEHTLRLLADALHEVREDPESPQLFCALEPEQTG